MSDFSWRTGNSPETEAAFTNSLFLRLHLDGLRQLGASLPEVLAAWGVPQAAIETLPDRVDARWNERFWQAAEAVTGDAFVGLRLAHLGRPEVDELVRSVVGQSDNLGDALAQLAAFGRVIDARLDFTLEVEGDEAVMVQQPARDGRIGPRQSTECMMAILGLVGCYLTGEVLRPSAAFFRHEAPAHLEGLTLHFGERLHFGGLRNALVFDRQYLSLPVVSLGEEQRLGLRREGDRLLRSLPDDGFLREVRAAVGVGLSQGTPAASQIAAALGLSERALRSRLRLRGTSLRLMVDGVRYRLALEYLKAEGLSVREVAQRLGYADSLAFGRAFRRWAGCSPQEFRVTH